MDAPLSKDRLDHFRELFVQAEKDIKAVELLRNDVTVAAINELRYAGHHLVRALTDTEERDEQLRRAERHCQRAIYDAVDSGIVYCLRAIKAFKTDYRLIPVTPVVADYADILSEARAAKSVVEEARGVGDERYKYCQTAREIFPKLVRCMRRLEDSREELNKLIELDKLRERREKKRHDTMVLLTAGCLGAAVFGAVFAYLALK